MMNIPMSFASRLDNLNPEGAYAVMAQANAIEAEGRKIIHLEIGQPDSETFPHISQEGINAIQSGHTRYNPPAGLPQLREVIADHAGAQRNMQIDPSQVVVGPVKVVRSLLDRNFGPVLANRNCHSNGHKSPHSNV